MADLWLGLWVRKFLDISSGKFWKFPPNIKFPENLQSYLWLPSQPQSISAPGPVPNYTAQWTEAHKCEQLAQSCYFKTTWSTVQLLNHCAIKLPSHTVHESKLSIRVIIINGDSWQWVWLLVVLHQFPMSLHSPITSEHHNADWKYSF